MTSGTFLPWERTGILEVLMPKRAKGATLNQIHGVFLTVTMFAFVGVAEPGAASDIEPATESASRALIRSLSRTGEARDAAHEKATEASLEAEAAPQFTEMEQALRDALSNAGEER